jgi:aspergillopepsin I
MLSSLTTVLALAAAAQAAPAPPALPVAQAGASAFSVQAVHSGAVRNGTAAMLKAYKKYNLQPTQDFSESFLTELALSRKRQDGSAPAVPTSQDSEYLVPVTVGGQQLNLDFDTGSADL